MNKQELIAKINEALLSDVRKSEILSMINAAEEITPELSDEIKDIIQEEIDEDISELLSDEDKKEIQAVEAEGDAEIKTITAEVVEDLNFVEKEIDDLDTVLASLDPVIDEIAIDEVKAGLDNATE
jgi:hypothetical protein